MTKKLRFSATISALFAMLAALVPAADDQPSRPAALHRLYLIDEVLTPDSSRFWPADQYRAGISPPSFDKQFVRDYLETLDWDKTAPGPWLPDEVVARTAEKYREAERLPRGAGHDAQLAHLIGHLRVITDILFGVLQ